MKEFTEYSDAFKKTVVNVVLDERISIEEARRRYGIKGKTTVLCWIRKFDTSKRYEMKKERFSKRQDITTPLEAENKRLHKELAIERLRVLSLNVMIDLAEEQFKVPIRKKSGAKQLKK
jgi:transposase-like protein